MYVEEIFLHYSELFYRKKKTLKQFLKKGMFGHCKAPQLAMWQKNKRPVTVE